MRRVLNYFVAYIINKCSESNVAHNACDRALDQHEPLTGELQTMSTPGANTTMIRCHEFTRGAVIALKAAGITQDGDIAIGPLNVTAAIRVSLAKVDFVARRAQFSASEIKFAMVSAREGVRNIFAIGDMINAKAVKAPRAN